MGRRIKTDNEKRFDALRAKVWLAELGKRLGATGTENNGCPIDINALVVKLQREVSSEHSTLGNAKSLKRYISGMNRPNNKTLLAVDSVCRGMRLLYLEGPSESRLFMAIDPAEEASTPLFLASMPNDFKQHVLQKNDEKRMSARAQGGLAFSGSPPKVQNAIIQHFENRDVFVHLSGIIMLYRYAIRTLHSLDYLDGFLSLMLAHEKTSRALEGVNIDPDEFIALAKLVIRDEARQVSQALGEGATPGRIAAIAKDGPCGGSHRRPTEPFV